MTQDLSKTQIDRLGERLKKGPLTEEDLILLDQFRQSFDMAYESVLKAVSLTLREQYPGIEPTGRAAKSTTSIIEKLRRESIRLTQIQDVAGCRLIVQDFATQNWIIERLFPDATLVDRRKNPSHGYRAVHIIARIDEKPVEIQVRTWLQHLWADISEKLADAIDSGIKYGRGNRQIHGFLNVLSEFVALVEEEEDELSEILHQIQESKFGQIKKSTANIMETIGKKIGELRDPRDFDRMTIIETYDKIGDLLSELSKWIEARSK